MKVLVTGSAGQVCSHICDSLLSAGHHVVGVDNHLSGVDNTPAGVEVIRKDLRDLTKLPDVDFVIHGASYAELAGNWTAPAERGKLFEHNERATRALLEVMPEVPIVYLSSASVYGSQCGEHGHRLNEAAPLSIESPYAASKAACEMYVQAWTYKWHQPWYVLRLCNQMGSRTHRGLVPDFVRMARAGHIQARDDGTQLRSWIHVQDTADIVTAIVAKRPQAGIYNVASGELWGWPHLAELIGVPFTRAPVRAGAIGDPVDIRLDASKARALLNHPMRSVESAFVDALQHLGWPHGKP